jgi:hypothetical protein
LDFNSALERAAQLQAKASSLAEALARSPNDRGLQVTLASVRRLAERAEEELKEVAQSSQVDLCHYRAVQTVDGPYRAADFANSIVTYQELLTALYDFVRNGPRLVARYSEAVKAQSQLNIAYTYPGSIGVLFTVENNRDLFNEGQLDRVIDALNQITDISSIDQVKHVARHMGLNVVRSAFRWADRNWQAAYSVEVQWRRSDAVIRGGLVPRARFLNIKSLISQTSEVEPREFESIGTLVGFNVLSDTFVFVPDVGDRHYSGKLGEGFPKTERKVPYHYKARILEKTVTSFATETIHTTYELQALTENT